MRRLFHSLDQPSTSQQQMDIHQTEEQFKRVRNDLTRQSYFRDQTNPVILKVPTKLEGSKPVGLHKNVLEKRVKLPQDLLTFIKSSRAILKYDMLFQKIFRNPVFMEVGSELVLSSLNSHDLDEAMAVVVNDLCVEIEKLQGAAAVPPDLDRIKEILSKSKKETNREELRVDVSFIPGQNAATVTKVRLVGYGEHVSKLREVLQDYLLNQVSTEHVVNLPHAELFDYFDDFLEMISMKQTKVTLKASLHPHPCVTVSGPRCHVMETHRGLTSALAGLTVDHLVLPATGALRYFQTDGKESKEQIESSCQVLIRGKTVSTPRSFVSSGSSIFSSSPSSRSDFLFVGRSKRNVDNAKTKLSNLYQAQTSTKTFTNEDLADLTQDDMKDLKTFAETEGLCLQEGQFSQGGLVVSGLKAGVNKVVLKLDTIIPLRREMRIKEEENLYPRVTWCIMGLDGSWERLPKTANYNLEKRNVLKGIADMRGVMWSVNLHKMEAKSGKTVKLKRLENLPDFTFPLYWDHMGNNTDFKEVRLEPFSAEYLSVQKAFNKTAHRTVVKIERLQNIHLRRVYEMQKKHLSEKNKLEGGAGERLLYHGTSQESCNSIKTKGFNRSFSGKNATMFGQGTYFAVNANYSASPTYSAPAADGTQAVFVARVLTGMYTLGRSDMKVPPPRNSQQPHDRYDSVVDNVNNPTMFVVFHDNQAYPDYLITFC